MSKKDLKIVGLISGLGIALCLYLIYSTYFISGPFCPTGGCEDLLKSEYAYFLGFPIAGWGLIYYVGLFALTIVKLPERLFRWAFPAYVGWGVIFSVYLRYLEFVKIGHICIWCWVSVLLIVIVSGIYIKNLLKKKSNTPS